MFPPATKQKGNGDRLAQIGQADGVRVDKHADTSPNSVLKVCACALQDVRARPPLPVPGDLAHPLHELLDVGGRETPGNVSNAERFESEAHQMFCTFHAFCFTAQL